MKRLDALHALQKTKDVYKMLTLAMDQFPGTEFDEVFERVELASFPFVPLEVCRDIWQWFGRYIARMIETGDSETLHRVADALNQWKRHNPNPDRIRATLIALCGWSAVGYPAEFGRLPKTNISVRDILHELRQLGAPINDNTQRLIRRYAKELGIELCHKPGRPRKTRTKAP